MKKIINSILIFTMLFSFSMTVFASKEGNETKSTVLTMSENKITDVGNRHIKVKWEKVDGANGYQLQIANDENFENAVIKSSKSIRLYYNFAEVPGDVKGTYYIRVRPKFAYKESEDGYLYGQWSNVVVAEYKEPTINPDVTLDNVDWFPWIPKGIDWSKLLLHTH